MFSGPLEKALHVSVFNLLKYHQKPKQMLWQQPQATECLDLDSYVPQVASSPSLPLSVFLLLLFKER